MMLSPDYVFDNYVSTMGSRTARAACLALANTIHPSYNPLFLYGPPSVGKTHLLHAVGNRVRGLIPYAKVTIASTEEMINDLCGALGDNAQMAWFREKYVRADLLLVDDIDILAGKERSQDAFFRYLREVIANGGRLAVAGSKPPADLPIFASAMKSKMKRCLMTTIKTPSKHDVETILSRKFASAAPPVSKSLIRMASGCGAGSDIRRAEGMVKQMAFADSQTRFQSFPTA